MPGTISSAAINFSPTFPWMSRSSPILTHPIMAAMNQSDRGDPPPPVPQGWDAAELGRLFRAITARVAIANLAAGALAFFYLNWLGIIHAGPAADSPRGHRDLLVSLVVVIAYVAVAS